MMKKRVCFRACLHDCLFVVSLYTSVHPLPSLLAELFPSPVFSANNGPYPQ